MQTVTVNFPEKIYGQLKRQSQITRRTVADEVTAVVVSSLTEETLPADIEEELAQLELFTDDELWHAAQLSGLQQKSDRMQELVEKQQLFAKNISPSRTSSPPFAERKALILLKISIVTTH